VFTQGSHLQIGHNINCAATIYPLTDPEDQSLGEFIPTGCKSVERVLGGGLALGKVTLIYGEAGAGKSSLLIQCALQIGRDGRDTLYIDPDRTFSATRFSQIAAQESEELSRHIYLLQPNSFADLCNVVENLAAYLTKQMALVAIDGLTSLYRLGIGNRKNAFRMNRDLNRIMATLSEFAASSKIAVAVTSQVSERITPESGSNRLEPVAHRVLRHWANVIVNLKKTNRTGVRICNLEKPALPGSESSAYFVLTEKGISDLRGSSD
jgi:DNA repair protein RadB